MKNLARILPGILLATVLPLAAPAQTWVSQTSNTIQDLNGLHVVSDLEGWIAANGGLLLHTLNGGTTWTSANLTNQDLQDVAFRDATTGIVVGDNGLIFRTINGGTTWTQVASTTTRQLRGVDWGSGDVVWATGRDGVVVRSANAGASWSSVNAPTLERFRRISANGANLAWAVGDNGTAWRTTNAGVSWVQETVPTNNNLGDVQFLTSTTGFTNGSNDMMLFSSDGGATWTIRNSGILQGQNGLHFLDVNTGWTVGDLGTIYHTMDAGLTWLPQASGTTQALNEVFFTSNGRGWAVGNGGVIVHSDQAVGGIPCDSIDAFQARCVAGGSLQFRINLLNSTQYAGEQVIFDVDGTQYTAVVGTNGTHSRAQVQLSGQTPGPHTITLVSPAGCFSPAVVTCATADRSGTEWEEFDAIWAGETGSLRGGAAPEETRILGNYPNPFNPSTTISYGLSQASWVTLKIFNVLGEEVASLVDEYQSAGVRSVQWNGRALDGAPVASGLYMYRLTAGDIVKTEKMLLMK